MPLKRYTLVAEEKVDFDMLARSIKADSGLPVLMEPRCFTI